MKPYAKEVRLKERQDDIRFRGRKVQFSPLTMWIMANTPMNKDRLTREKHNIYLIKVL
jgi:hypothetical protein